MTVGPSFAGLTGESPEKIEKKMNKNRHILFLSAAALLTLAGCLKDPGPGDGEGLRMQVEPSVAEATKGSLTTGTLADFYLRVVSGDPAYSYFVHLSKDGSGAWVSPTQLLWKGADASVDYAAARFGAYAFKAADFASGVSVALTVPADQSTQERLDAADLLTAPTATKAYSATVAGALPVAFRHALAKVRFTLTLGPDFFNNNYSQGGNPVKDFTVKGVNGGFVFTPSTGAVSVGDAPVDIVPLAGTFTPGTSESKNATATYEAILVPQAYPAGTLKVAFRVGDYEYEWTNAASLTLAAGKTYELPLSASTAPPPALEAIDLGLPSGLKWASCNLGAGAPEEGGDYFVWSDVASKTFGGGWRLPTKAEMEELIDNTTYIWTTENGVSGGLFTATNGSRIFLPAAGLYNPNANTSMGTHTGYYWSSTVDDSVNNQVYGLTINHITPGHSINVSNGNYGFKVRLVKK